MPNLTTENIGTGDQRWLGSTHAIYNTQSVALSKAAFTAGTHYPNGYLPSGLPLGQITASGLFGPYDGAATDGRQNLAGFLYTDSKVTADAEINGAMLDHGRIRTKYLPVAFTPPADTEHFVFVTAANA